MKLINSPKKLPLWSNFKSYLADLLFNHIKEFCLFLIQLYVYAYLVIRVNFQIENVD
jgi:hypothetical protein